jgi:hypothetical protein
MLQRVHGNGGASKQAALWHKTLVQDLPRSACFSLPFGMEPRFMPLFFFIAKAESRMSRYTHHSRHSRQSMLIHQGEGDTFSFPGADDSCGQHGLLAQ